MVKICCFIFVVLPFLRINAQEDLNETMGLDIIRNIEKEFCEGDTLETIEYLKKFIQKFPVSGTSVYFMGRLAEFYFQLDQKDIAFDLSKNSLLIEPKGFFYVIEDTCNFYKEIPFTKVKADICLMISKEFEKIGNNYLALEYLNLADTEYLPHKFCGNGMNMARTKLSLDFADFYLRNGDTTKAINRLFDYFLSDEYGDVMVAKKLKSILLTKYSQKEIAKEIECGIKKMKIVKGKEKDDFDKLEFTFFGHVIKKNVYKNLRLSKKYYSTNKLVLFLMDKSNL
ncbi:MAG: hypothetical protein IPP53_14790 [Bacteroidetes bacterium]|nr:hypothetical protein [Bacteroidota bacterium]